MNAIDFTNDQDSRKEQDEIANSRIEAEQDHDFDIIKKAREDVDKEVEDNHDDSAKYEQEVGLDGEENQFPSNALGNPMVENSDDPNDDLHPLYKVGGHIE